MNEELAEQILASLLAIPNEKITYLQIESQLEQCEVDPQQSNTIYEWLLEQLESKGKKVVEELESTESNPNLEEIAEIARQEADEIGTIMAEILQYTDDDFPPLLKRSEVLDLVEIYREGLRAKGELDSAVSGEHYDQIWRRVSEGEKAFAELLRRNKRLVAKEVLKKVKYLHHLEFDDLMQEGMMGLMKAIDRFDLDSNWQLSTYATWWIRQAIERANADKERLIRLPVHMFEQVRQVQAVVQKLTQRNEKPPTDQEVVIEMGLLERNDLNHIKFCAASNRPFNDDVERRLDRSAKRILHLRQLGEFAPLSLEQPINDDSEVVLADALPDLHAPTPEEWMEAEELRTVMSKVLTEINQREREVLCRRFGLSGEERQTLEEIGKSWNITRERVRQIEAKALMKLRHPVRARKLRDFVETISNEPTDSIEM